MKSGAGSHDVELEAKYVVDTEQLRSAYDVLTNLKDKHVILIAGVRQETIEDQYFDTRDFALASHQASLRLRKTKVPGYVLSFKRNYPIREASDSLFSRIEIEGVPEIKLIRKIAQHAPWLAFHLSQEAHIENFSGELEMFRSMGLFDICRIHNERTLYTVLYDDNLKVEVCFDHVEAVTLQNSIRFYEMECEYLSGDQEAFHRFCNVIEDNMPWLKASSHNKYLTSLLALKVWKPKRSTRQREVRIWSKKLNKIYNRFASKYKRAITFKNPEDLHQTRVSIRQLSTLLGFLLNRSQKKNKCANECLLRLKKAQKLLGRIRDYDVFIESFGKQDDVSDQRNRLNSEIQVLLSLERDRLRLKGLKRLPKYVNKDLSKNWKRFLNKELPSVLKDIDLQSDYIDLKRRYALGVKQFLKSREIRGATHPITVSNLHKSRLLTKKLRYAAEYLSFALPGDQSDDIKKYKHLQTLLGDINDLYNHQRVYSNFREELGTIVGSSFDEIIEELNAEIELHIHNLSESDFYLDPAVTAEPVEELESLEMAATGSDNQHLTAIKGIGPKTAELLTNHGISSMQALASLSSGRLE